MFIKNDVIGIKNLIDFTVQDFYKRELIACYVVGAAIDTEENFSFEYLIHKKYTIQILATKERYSWVGEVRLGIGPIFVHPAAFWSYEKSQEFSMNVTKEGIITNLQKLEQFFNERHGQIE